jgi:hypothetical protein
MSQYIKNISKYKFIFLLFLLAEACQLPMQAAPGDTTWVTIYNLRKLTQYGNYDTTAVFPTGKRYRKIRLHYILGRYSCPSGTQYCGSWDYTTMIIARPAGKDTAEIARVITPYATNWLGLNKKHDYVVDVTDYASVLEGTTGMRFRYEGYSWGFTITLKLEFIEGIPAMDALSVKKVYDGYFQYGNASNSIENYLTAKTFTYPSTVSKIFLKNSVSGHGSDATGCAEFCSKFYNLKINNTQFAQKQLWRADCGINEVYPQTGTWIYDRSNWCPGAIVWPIYHDLTSTTTANTTFSVDVDMQPYNVGANWGGYNWVSQLIHYSAPNHTRDISIEEIVTPNNNENYVRENPACANPIFRIRNTGTDTVKSIVFSYGLVNGAPLTYKWTGSLGFLDTTNVIMPPSTSVLNHTITKVFTVTADSVNGLAGDEDLFNNIYRSNAPTTAIFPQDIVIKFLTNNSSDITGFNESSWTMWDENGNVINWKSGMNNATLYSDTIIGLPPGCYKITINDGGCDGLSWWANTAGGNGYMRIYNVNAPTTVYNFPTDFGCSFTKYFTVVDPFPNYVGINENPNIKNSLEVFPNPASKSAYVNIELNNRQDVVLKLTDISGRIVSHRNVYGVVSATEKIELQDFAPGIYIVSIELSDKTIINKKLVVEN